MQSPQEGRAFEQLRKVVAGHGGSVHMTTKLSAITDPSTLSGRDFDWATRAELDLLVRDEAHLPLFALEVDGAHHELEPEQARRDRLKDRLLKEAGIDMLRVRAADVAVAHGTDQMCAYLADLWFTAQAFHEAQERGDIGPTEIFIPWATLRPSPLGGMEPMTPDISVRVMLHEDQARGLLPISGTPSVWSRYRDDVGLVDVLALLPIRDELCLISNVTVGLSRVPGVPPADIAEEVALLDLGRQWISYSQGRPEARRLRDLGDQLAGIAADDGWRTRGSDGVTFELSLIHI